MKIEDLFIGELVEIVDVKVITMDPRKMLYLTEEQKQWFRAEGLNYIENYDIRTKFVAFTILKRLPFGFYQDLKTDKYYRNNDNKKGKVIVDEKTLIPFNSFLSKKDVECAKNQPNKKYVKKYILNKYNEIMS